MTYQEARASLKSLNERIHDNHKSAPKIDAGTEAHEAYLTRRRVLNDVGNSLGFIRIFDGSFKLDLTKFEGKY